MRTATTAIRKGFDRKLNLINYSIRNTGKNKLVLIIEGLFGYPALSHPEGLAKAAQNCLQQATKLVELVCNAQSDLEISKTIKRVDAISDTLCSVLDPAEFIRNVHPDEAFVNVADNVSMALHNFLSQLNTHPGLYTALRKVMDHPTIGTRLSVQEKKVAMLLLEDFEKSGVHMPLDARKRFITLSDDIQTLGKSFSDGCSPGQESVAINDISKLKGIPSQLITVLKKIQDRNDGRIIIPTHSEVASIIMRTAFDENVRRDMFHALNSATEEQIITLEKMLLKRGELAKLLGKKSYAEMYLADKMAETPENVITFLESLSTDNRPKADLELKELLQIKKEKTGINGKFEAWDRFYFGQFLSSSSQSNLSNYFSVGTTFEGLSSIFYSLYGIRFELEETIPGEVWHEDVRKLSVIHETEGLIGTIYCDLFQREAEISRKFDNAAHFTVCCTRRVDNDESFLQGNNEMKNQKYEKTVFDENGNAKRYQLPIVVLVTSFRRSSNGVPTLLDLHDLETLFHEMGHAMHSMLSQTDFQHTSGTRVVMDFVEVPSVLMEFFANSSQVLGVIGRHFQTDEHVPIQLLESAFRKQSIMQSLETQNQIQMALLDQKYHSGLATLPGFNSSEIMFDLSKAVNSIPSPPSSRWQGQFSHLFTYGSSYYSYLWCKRWASKIYSKHFADKEMSNWRPGGDVLRKELLGVGGTRDPKVGLQKIGVW